MFKISMSLCAVLIIGVCYILKFDPSELQHTIFSKNKTTSHAIPPDWPAELEVTNYTGPDLTPSPACLAVAPTGEVFVGVDMIGSLGKTPGKGSII
ncbi:MAG: hypothetical protein ABIN89_17990, partial [Chitinophagaceae bacterium]